MEGFGEKSLANLDEAIEKSRHTTFIPFIYSLGIPNIGRGQAKMLLPYVKKYVKDNNIHGETYGDSLINGLLSMAWEDYDFTQINGFGDILANSIQKYFYSIAEDSAVYGYQNEFEDLRLNLIFDDKEEVSEEKNDFFVGKTFVITGSVEHFANRDEIKEYIEKKGGKVSGSVSSKTSYLVNNDVTSNSGKNKKAKDLGVPIISEKELLEK